MVESSRKWLSRAIVGALALTTGATSVQAASYNLFDAFNGTAAGVPGSGYTFGYAAAGAFGGTLTAFDTFATSACRGGDANIACAVTTVDREVAIYKAIINGGAYDQTGSAFYDAGELNFHPGVGGQNAGFQFSGTGSFTYTIGISSNDSSGRHSVDYRLFQGTTLLGSGIVDSTSANLSGTVNIANDGPISLLIGANGNFSFDSTGVTATFSDVAPPPVGAVPEPSTWAMMIVGFGTIGGTLRRRARVGVRFAST